MSEETIRMEPLQRSLPERRRVLGAVVGGAAALAVWGGVRMWAGGGSGQGARKWGTTEATGRLALAPGAPDTLYASATDGTVRALDAGSGAVRWTRALGEPAVGGDQGGWPVAAGEGVVCVATGTRLFALDAASGEVRWAVPTPGRPSLPWVQDPAIGGGAVFAVHGTTANGTSSTGTTVHSYDAATGSLRWSSPPVSSGFLALAGDTVYTAHFLKGLYAFDAKSGEQRWQQNSGFSAVGVPPVVNQGLVLLSQTVETAGASFLAAFDGATGTKLWGRDLGGTQIGPPAAVGGTILQLTGDRVVGVDLHSGEPRWQTAVFEGAGRGTLAMTQGEGRVYVATGGGRVHTVDTGGATRWRDAPEGIGAGGAYARVFLAAAGGVVFRGGDAGVQAFSL
ncbi:PQQ-binding-like beta-propeller repeat protein [Kitasatospora sp. NPDC101183]|uniref:outer membrane protein assembly factor BamB family protein n=1 Tax=Kitasatospora sp. NPDC101183 TaxID=3364100 RepID=UPI0037F3EC73